MDIIEAYIFLFFDSLMSSIIFPIQTNLVFPAMMFFEGYNTSIIIIIATIGAMTGAMLNFGLGRLIVTTSKFKPEGKRAIQFFNFCHNQGRYILLFSWFPVLGSVLTVVTGAAKMRASIAFLIIFIVHLAYYTILALIY